MSAERVLISIDLNLLTRVDEYVKSNGMGANRSGFFRDAGEYYLNIKKGIMNKIRKKQLHDEKV